MIDDFIIHSNSRLRCLDNFENIETINWYKNGKLYTPENDNGEFKYNKSYIYFSDVRLSLSGSYSCELVFKNGQHLMSSNSVEIEVKSMKFKKSLEFFKKFFNFKATVPSTPIIKSILPLKYSRAYGVLIQWDVEYDDIPIECVNITEFRQKKDHELKSTAFEICK